MGLSIAFFDLPNGGYIEIIVPTRDNSVISPTMKKSGPGMHLIAFNCENLKSCVDQFKKDGIKVMDEIQKKLEDLAKFENLNEANAP